MDKRSRRACPPKCSATPRSSRRILGQSLLEVKALEVRYGGIRAVKGIDLVVDEGELVCLIGANGAGKTTTLKALCGVLPVAAGSVTYSGRVITGAPSFRLVRDGLVLVPERRCISA